MEWSLISAEIWVYFFGVFAAILLYLSSGLSSLNSAQLERLFESSDESPTVFGLKLSTTLISVKLAASLMELAFFMSLILARFLGDWSWNRVIAFLSIGMAFEILSRFLLPAGIPMRNRHGFTGVEKRLIQICGYLLFFPAFVIEKIVEKSSEMLFPKTADTRLAQAEDTIKSMIDVGEKEGIFKDEEGELLHSIVEFSDTIAREVMTPRIDLKSIEISQSLEDLVNLVVQTGYSKIPAYQGRIDEIVGILYAKDLLKVWNTESTRIELDQIFRPAYFIPETKKVKNLLREFQKEKMHMAIVVDEYGGVAGVVTIEDLLEEIVGEIQDEYDEEPDMFAALSEDSWLVDAKIDLDELSEVLNVPFPEENYETLGGFLFDQIGHVPEPGESTDYKNLSIEVKEADERRILKVLIHRKEIEPEEENGEKNGE